MKGSGRGKKQWKCNWKEQTTTNSKKESRRREAKCAEKYENEYLFYTNEN